MTLQPQTPATADASAREGAQETRKYLYIVARGVNARSSEIFAAMRRDMARASVELLYDRRAAERRSAAADDGVDQERRRSDRRQRDATKEIVDTGWVRVTVE